MILKYGSSSPPRLASRYAPEVIQVECINKYNLTSFLKLKLSPVCVLVVPCTERKRESEIQIQ